AKSVTPFSAFKPTKSLQSLPKSYQTRLCFWIMLGQSYQYAEPLHSVGLLRARRERPRSRRTAEQSDELAPLHFSAHSITSSARNRIEVGTLRPSAWAVLRLMKSSNLVGCTTGRSAGVAP